MADVITTVAGIVQNITYGPHHTVVISEAPGRGGPDIVKLLHVKGIKTWFHDTPGGECITFNVRKDDAAEAYNILAANGIKPDSAAPKGSKQEGKGKMQGYEPGAGWGLFG